MMDRSFYIKLGKKILKDQGFRPKLPHSSRDRDNHGEAEEQSAILGAAEKNRCWWSPWVASNTWATRLSGCFGHIYVPTQHEWLTDSTWTWNPSLVGLTASSVQCCPEEFYRWSIHNAVCSLEGSQGCSRRGGTQSCRMTNYLQMIDFCQHGLHGYAKFGHGWWSHFYRPWATACVKKSLK